MHNFSQQQIDLFNNDSHAWWEKQGPFALLHTMTPLRVEYILSHLESISQSIQGMRILDVGCGGGILCEPLARLGAKVTGIDASKNAIDCAIAHRKMMGLAIDYHHTTIEEFVAQMSVHTTAEVTPTAEVTQINESNIINEIPADSPVAQSLSGFDLVIASEIIEHIPDQASFLKACYLALKSKQHTSESHESESHESKPDVSQSKHAGLILSTINRTPKSYAGAIVAAEYILRWVPVGTHDWNLFLKPSEIAEMTPLNWVDIRGLSLNPLTKKWSFSDDLSINYIGALR